MNAIKIKTKKGQGALEYLLLIGGAVLIAVIVIAIIVTMSNSSQKSVTESGQSATNLLDQPNTPLINNVIAKGEDCNDSAVDGKIRGIISVSWTPSSEGRHTIHIYDYSENELIVDVITPDQPDPCVDENGDIDNIAGCINELPTTGGIVTNIYVDLNHTSLTKYAEKKEPIRDCQNRYTAIIETAKNEIVAKSPPYNFNWGATP